MLFGYPIAAVAENWLHDSILAMLKLIHADAEAQTNTFSWPSSIPEDHRKLLKSRTGLRDRLYAYRDSLKQLGGDEQVRIFDCLTAQNDIEDLLSCNSECDSMSQMPDGIKSSIEDLFEFSFGLLSDLGIRDRQYKIIYDSVEDHVCPFCGCEFFDFPVEPGKRSPHSAKHVREALDHYMPRSRYPFAAANLSNLAPIGHKCNSYKLDQDILRDAEGVRCKAFYPYSNQAVSISLNESVPFAGSDGEKPRWEIDFYPNTPECETWDRLFSLRERLRRDVLDPSFKRWLSDFSEWFRILYGAGVVTDARVVSALEKYAKLDAVRGHNGRDYFRSKTFRMLHHHCSLKHTRLLNLIKDSLKLSVPPIVGH